MMEYETKEVIHLPTDSLLDDPEAIRPEIGSVADIEPWIKREGIIFPIEVRRAVEDGKFYVCEGNRRVFVARKIGLETVPAHIRDIDAAGARRIMMASDLRRAQPHVVVRKVDDEEQIVGGLALAIKREKEESEASNQSLADMLGDKITADTVGAYLQLFDEHMEIVKAVASGKLAITAYSRMKSQPTEVKLAVIGKDKESISANDVRETIKQQRRAAGDTNSDLPFMGEVSEHAQALGTALAILRKMHGANFTNDEIVILEQIVDQAEDLIVSN